MDKMWGSFFFFLTGLSLGRLDVFGMALNHCVDLDVTCMINAMGCPRNWGGFAEKQLRAAHRPLNWCSCYNFSPPLWRPLYKSSKELSVSNSLMEFIITLQHIKRKTTHRLCRIKYTNAIYTLTGNNFIHLLVSNNYSMYMGKICTCTMAENHNHHLKNAFFVFNWNMFMFLRAIEHIAL